MICYGKTGIGTISCFIQFSSAEEARIRAEQEAKEREERERQEQEERRKLEEQVNIILDICANFSQSL